MTEAEEKVWGVIAIGNLFYFAKILPKTVDWSSVTD